MILATLLILVTKNSMNLVVIIFDVTVLDSRTPIIEAMLDVEYMTGLVIAVVKAMVAMEEAVTMPVEI